MARKSDCVEVSGVFEGLRVPKTLRGKYVLISKGQVLASALSPRVLVRKAVAAHVLPVILHVPVDNAFLAAY